jgi:Protein of unknown function (Porph_ging).
MREDMRKITLLAVILSSLSTQAQLPANIRQLLSKEGGMNMTLPSGMFLEKCEKLDSCLLKVTYRVSFLSDTLRKDSREEDIQILQVGKNLTKCFSYPLYQNDSIRTLMKSKGVYENLPRVNKTYLPEDVYTFIKEKRNEVLYRGTEDALPFYWYSEDTPQIKWNLSDETKTIIGYNCRKASCNFRGRSYIAWYTMDVPLKTGPYKFSGLPGLILSIFDTANEYSWICIGLEKSKCKTSIERYSCKSYKTKKTTRESIRKEILKTKEDPVAAYNRNGKFIIVHNFGGGYGFMIVDYSADLMKGFKGDFYNMISHDLPSEPYNPVEKE